MPHHDLIDQLALQLHVDASEAGRLLGAFCGALSAELLETGKLSIGGLGSFIVVHRPSARKITSSGVLLTPPCNALVHERRLSGRDDAARLAVSRLSMSTLEGARFARELSALLADGVKNKQEIRLNGFGRFSLEEGIYRFRPEHSLEELLNRGYGDLGDLVVGSPGAGRGVMATRMVRYVLPIAVLVLIVTTTAFYGLGARKWLDFPSFQLSRFVPHPAMALDHSRPAGAATLGRGSVADSLLLEHGEYTIILATFRQKATAEHELIALRSAGIDSYIWPASVDGVKYYRLMTGRFSSRTAASNRLKELPAKASGDAYIQHVIKRVVLYGEKGL